jgi:hypothetical protein
VRLLLDALLAYAKDQDEVLVARDYKRRHDEMCAARAVLIDFTRYWDTLSAALTGREKMIIDADKLPGRTHLWMVPLEPFRFPLPGMLPPQRPNENP